MAATPRLRLFVSLFRRPFFLRGQAGACLTLACALVLASCGGGQLAGVGSGGSGIAEGTVSGFGSVIVDGIEYSDTAVDAATVASLRLGQRVRLVFGAGNAAQSITVLPQLRGPVGRAPDADGWMQVSGQWVRLVQSAADASRSGVTVLDGYASAAAIQAGQDVSAYGSWAFDASRAAYVLVATRVEQQAAADPVLTGGVVQAPLDGSGFRLNAATGTAVVADRLPALAVGQVVTVQVARASLGTVPLRAQDVQNTSLGALDLGAFAEVRLGGLAGAYDAAAGTVTVQGTQVPLAPGLANASGVVAVGQFVRLDASAAGNGTLLADAAAVRSTTVTTGEDGTGGTNQLKGTLSGVDWNASAVRFTLRGVEVVADGADIAASCRATPTTATLYAEVDGFTPLPGAAVVATQVRCSATVPPGA